MSKNKDKNDQQSFVIMLAFFTSPKMTNKQIQIEFRKYFHKNISISQIIRYKNYYKD